jgi:hypothetical protein
MQYPSAPFFKHGRHFRVEIRKSTEAHGVYRFKTLSKTVEKRELLNIRLKMKVLLPSKRNPVLTLVEWNF